MNRAISSISIRSVDEDQRIIRGIATSPAMDRVGDIIEPLGVRVRGLVPLLAGHAHDKPVGTVKFDKPTKQGVTFTAKLPQIVEPGALKDRVDTAWSEVKHGLITSVSIGFRPIDGAYERLPSGGIHFKEIEIYELSLVAVPAQAEALILEAKAANSIPRTRQVRLDRPRTRQVRLDPQAIGGRKRATTLSKEIEASWEAALMDAPLDLALKFATGEMLKRLIARSKSELGIDRVVNLNPADVRIRRTVASGFTRKVRL